jgi:hypothetical protein
MILVPIAIGIRFYLTYLIINLHFRYYYFIDIDLISKDKSINLLLFIHLLISTIFLKIGVYCKFKLLNKYLF